MFAIKVMFLITMGFNTKLSLLVMEFMNMNIFCLTKPVLNANRHFTRNGTDPTFYLFILMEVFHRIRWYLVRGFFV